MEKGNPDFGTCWSSQSVSVTGRHQWFCDILRLLVIWILLHLKLRYNSCASLLCCKPNDHPCDKNETLLPKPFRPCVSFTPALRAESHPCTLWCHPHTADPPPLWLALCETCTAAARLCTWDAPTSWELLGLALLNSPRPAQSHTFSWGPALCTRLHK